MPSPFQQTLERCSLALMAMLWDGFDESVRDFSWLTVTIDENTSSLSASFAWHRTPFSAVRQARINSTTHFTSFELGDY
jgi:hypothetical protein